MDGVILIVIYCNGEKYLINENQIYEPFPEKEGKEDETSRKGKLWESEVISQK